MEWTDAAHAVASLGPQSKALITKIFEESKNRLPFDEIALKHLARSLEDHWKDESAALMVDTYVEAYGEGHSPDGQMLRRWALAHPNAPEKVGACIRANPPKGILIQRLWSDEGSQKLVFLADWELQLKEIVLKKIILPDNQEKLWHRESQSSTLGMRHPNILPTHPMRNDAGEYFVAEERISALDDEWLAGGVEVAANALFDLANALAYLHENLQLVHGDVKPDNMGVYEGRFVLLDFGICRRIQDYEVSYTPTGSLRTRPPELLSDAVLEDPTKLDTWALCASVFNMLEGRYPFFLPGELQGKIDPQDRPMLEEKIRRRMESEWDTYVRFEVAPEAIRSLLTRGLTRNPADRAGARELLEAADKELGPFLKRPDRPLSPLTELAQILKYLSDSQILAMPPDRREHVRQRLESLRNSPACADKKIEIEALIEKLDE